MIFSHSNQNIIYIQYTYIILHYVQQCIDIIDYVISIVLTIPIIYVLYNKIIILTLEINLINPHRRE